MSKSDTRKLVCSACKHENEPERVYCHNCGEKLDRSLLPKIEETVSEEDVNKKKKQVQRMMNPNRFRLGVALRKLVLILLLSASVAAVYLATQAPVDTPPLKSEEIASGDARDLWKMMMNSPQATVPFKQIDINQSVRQSVKPEPWPLGIKAERAFTIIKPHGVMLATQRDLWGLPLYMGVTLKPAVVDGKWSPGIVGLNIGRLGIHPAAGRFAGSLLAPFEKAFASELGQIERLEKIEPGEKVITFATKAGR